MQMSPTNLHKTFVPVVKDRIKIEALALVVINGISRLLGYVGDTAAQHILASCCGGGATQPDQVCGRAVQYHNSHCMIMPCRYAMCCCS